MKHAVVFVDHKEARIYFPDGTSAEPEGRVLSKHKKEHDGHRPPLDKEAADALCTRVKDVEEILLVGPGSAKHELNTWIAEHHPDVSRRIVGVETVDHPTAGELKNLALKSFRRIDAFR